MRLGMALVVWGVAWVLGGCLGGGRSGQEGGLPAADRVVASSGRLPMLSALAEEGSGPRGVHEGLAVVVLGSGGPATNLSGRASAAYLVLLDGKPGILMDAGGGSLQRLAESGLNIKDLEFVLLSHLHVDHTADLPAFVKDLYFQNRFANRFREKPIRVFGPAENGITFPQSEVMQYPGLSAFVDQLFMLEAGAYRYLNLFSKAINGGVFQYQTHDLPSALEAPIQVAVDEEGLVIKSVGVHHGPVPANAFRIEYAGRSVVYSGDTSSRTDNLIALAMNADVLIYDAAVLKDQPETEEERIFFALHTTPTRMGAVAAAAGVKKLVLSHLGTTDEAQTERAIALIREQDYEGQVVVARDLGVIQTAVSP